MSTNFSDDTRRAIALFALLINTFIGVVGLWLTVQLTKLVIVKHWISMGFAAAAFGVGAILLLCETIRVLRESCTGPMPVAMSRERPLFWAAFAAILAGMILVAVILAIAPR